MVERTLYRQPGGIWVLVERRIHTESRRETDRTPTFLTPSQAARLLIESGRVLPADLAAVVRAELDAAPLADPCLTVSATPDEEVRDEPVATLAADKAQAPRLDLIPGGFTYGGRPHVLVGQPRIMLEALLRSRHHRCTALDLRKVLDLDDEFLEYPEQAVKDAAKKLRAALKEALAAAGQPCKNPLPSKGKSEELVYILALP
jgi:hypothetical protein